VLWSAVMEFASTAGIIHRHLTGSVREFNLCADFLIRVYESGG
jgi:hypothetical protein